MPMIDPLIAELQHEAATTRRLLELCPEESFLWKPHDKSMTLGQLASHISEIPGWISMTLTTTVLDFAKGDYKPKQASSTRDLLATFDESVAGALNQMRSTPDSNLSVEWTMRNGDQIFFTLPRIAILRTWCFNHWYHHRGQLSVYLRLKNIPLPSIYGPTADSPGM